MPMNNMDNLKNLRIQAQQAADTTKSDIKMSSHLESIKKAMESRSEENLDYKQMSKAFGEAISKSNEKNEKVQKEILKALQTISKNTGNANVNEEARKRELKREEKYKSDTLSALEKIGKSFSGTGIKNNSSSGSGKDNVAKITKEFGLDPDAITKGIMDSVGKLKDKMMTGLLGLGLMGGLVGGVLSGNWGPFTRFAMKSVQQMLKPLAGVANLFKKSFKGVGTTISKGLKNAFKTVGTKLIKGLGSIGKSIGKILPTGLKTFFAPIKSFGTNILKNIGKIFGKGVGKGVAKTGIAKFGAKLLKNIPVIGALISIPFAISRFKKGDVLGGLLELGSGLAGTLNAVAPGLGTAIGVAIDTYLIFRDIKGDEYKSQQNAKFKAFGKEALKNSPLIGTIWRTVDAIKLWKAGDKQAALKEGAHALATVLPGGGWIFGMLDKLLTKKYDEASPEQQAQIKAVSKDALKNLPLIGTVMRGMDAIELWKSGDKAAALEEAAHAFATLIPGGGFIFSILQKFVKDKTGGGVVQGIGGFASSAAENVKEWAGNILDLPFIKGPMTLLKKMFTGIFSLPKMLIDKSIAGVKSIIEKLNIKKIKSTLAKVGKAIMAPFRLIGKTFKMAFGGIKNIIGKVLQSKFVQWAASKFGLELPSALPADNMNFSSSSSSSSSSGDIGDPEVDINSSLHKVQQKDAEDLYHSATVESEPTQVGGRAFSEFKTSDELAMEKYIDSENTRIDSRFKAGSNDYNLSLRNWDGLMPTEGLINFQEGDGPIITEGLHPALWNNFNGMARDYYLAQKAAGIANPKPIDLNSAIRDTKAQERLYEKDLLENNGVASGKVARPGSSMHEYGMALDIDTDNANELARIKLPGENKTIMEKWGFRRYALTAGVGPASTYNPAYPGNKFQETWHIEPVEGTYNIRSQIRQNELAAASVNIPNRQDIYPMPMPTRSNTSGPSGDPQIDGGDAHLALNARLASDSIVPSVEATNKIQVQDQMINNNSVRVANKIELGENTIKQLGEFFMQNAQAIGESMPKSLNVGSGQGLGSAQINVRG
jgi:hypothetical protein